MCSSLAKVELARQNESVTGITFKADIETRNTKEFYGNGILKSAASATAKPLQSVPRNT